MKAKSAPIDIDPIRLQRQYYRNIFWAAYDVYKARTNVAIPIMQPTGDLSYTGGPHDPAWVKWAQWRMDFRLAGESILKAEQLTIFIFHLCHLEGEEKHLSIRKVAERIQEEFGTGSVTAYLIRTSKDLIAEKVGTVLDSRKLWPIYDGAGGGYFG